MPFALSSVSGYRSTLRTSRMTTSRRSFRACYFGISSSNLGFHFSRRAIFSVFGNGLYYRQTAPPASLEQSINKAQPDSVKKSHHVILPIQLAVSGWSAWSYTSNPFARPTPSANRLPVSAHSLLDPACSGWCRHAQECYAPRTE